MGCSLAIVSIIQYYKWESCFFLSFVPLLGTCNISLREFPLLCGWMKKVSQLLFYGRSKLLQKPFRIQSCYINEVNAFYGEATLGFPLCDTFSSSKYRCSAFLSGPMVNRDCESPNPSMTRLRLCSDAMVWMYFATDWALSQSTFHSY